jgi:hypothetical protein
VINRLARVDRGEDLIFHDIERHQEAIDAHCAAVSAECEAEDKVSAEVYAALQRLTAIAFEQMMLRGRMLAICNVKSRRGLIALARHLERQFGIVCDSGGCNSIPDEINGRPWAREFMHSLAGCLRSMGSEFPEPGRKGRRQGRVTP